MKRLLRIRFAALAACMIAFAQIAVAAQPWPLDVAPRTHAPASAGAAQFPCSGHHAAADGTSPSHESAPSPNFCEVHCQDAAQPDAMAAIAVPVPGAWLAVPLAEPVFERMRSDVPLDAKCASPPARLLFSRFLI